MWTGKERNVEENQCDGPSSETWTRSGASMAPSHETCRLVSWETCRAVLCHRSATGTTGAQRHFGLVCSSSLGSDGTETCRACDPGEVTVYQA